ncbi:MAG: transglutaminase family protein [Melioribacteraceae bacterium]|nr:transglutaminase family protein [Melioribacteraceae bacterium]
MAEKKDLPYLVSLIDDDISEVRDEVLRELSNYGSHLEQDLYEFINILDSNKIELIRPIIESSRRIWLKENWITWQTLEDEYSRIESACTLISRYQYGMSYEKNLADELNNLMIKFVQFYPHGDEYDLARFLFMDERIEGEKLDFYNPKNSNVLFAITEKRGLPITLSIIYMLVGKRIGMNIDGCNFPGHFLTKFKDSSQTVFVDCFNNGRIVYEDELKELLYDSYESIMDILNENTTANTIIRRVVSNLINAYKEEHDQLNRFLFSEILQSTPVN